MSSLSCQICLIPYIEEVPPRMFPCGHSCCTSCIREILTTAKNCPYCRKPLANCKAENYPVNYGMLEMFDDFANSPVAIANIRNRLEAVNKKHKRILSYVVAALFKAQSHKSGLEVMHKSATTLRCLIEKEDCLLNVKEVNTKLHAIEESMNDIAKIFCCEQIAECFVDFQLNSSEFKCDDYHHFLKKIYDEITTGKTVLAVKVIKGEQRFAKISIRDTTVFLHAFNSTTKDSNAVVVKFEDLKHVFVEQPNQKTFMDFTSTSGFCQRVIIQCIPDNALAYSFLQSCTGESGSSYLNSTSRKYCNIVEITVSKGSELFNKFSGNCKEDLDKYCILLSKSSLKFEGVKNTYYVSLDHHRFESLGVIISQYLDYPLKGVVGSCFLEGIQIVASSSSFNLVNDCGIVLEFPSQFLCEENYE